LKEEVNKVKNKKETKQKGDDLNLDPDFQEWLIGFTEGDGSFVINKRGDLSFVLIQSEDNKEILYKIKDK
jgi:hypothetical protein